MNDELYSQPELCREHSKRTAPQGTLADACKQHDTIGDVSLQFQCYRPSIDKGILGEQP